MRTIVDAIRAGAGDDGRLTVLGHDGEVAASLPWSAVNGQAGRMASVFAASRIRRGSRVGLLADTSLELVTAIQAVWLAGAAVTVLPPPARGGGNLQAIIADARPDLIVTTHPGVMGAPTMTLSELAAAAAAGPSPPGPDGPDGPEPGDLAILQYSSGSTRSPRGIPVTHAHLAANIAAIRAATDHEALHPGPAVSWLPLHHDMGLIGFLTVPMACGCPLVLQSPTAFARRPAGWLEALSRYRATASGGPNFAYALLTRLLVAGLDVALDSVRFLLTGGEPVDAATMASFTAAGARHGLDPRAIVPAYGLAESTLAVTFAPPGAGVRVDRVDPDALEYAGRAAPAPGGRPFVMLGRPVPGTDLRVVGTRSGEPVGPRRVGHIEVRGPSVVGHYWGEPVPPRGSWVRTGDLGYLADGELVVCGRAKDVLFAAGRNIFPQDIEAAAAEVPGVRAGRVAAFGVPGHSGERLVVAVEARGVDPETIRREVAAAVLSEVGLSPYAIVTLPAGRLPRTSSGKLRRAEARRLYQCGDLTPERTVR